MITLGEAGLSAAVHYVHPWRDPRCHGKRTHKSEGAARAQIRSLLKRELCDATRIRPYWCASCSGWHIGHGPL